MATALEEVLEKYGLELIQREIGRGGSATVHQCKVAKDAEHFPAVGTLVAVKEYSQDILSVPNQLERIRQEAKVGASLNHKNIVKTYGLIEDTSLSTSMVLLILEWIEGLTLDKWYAAQPKPVPWSTLCTISSDLIDALGALHGTQILHRDIKPENIMVGLSGIPVLMDTGVSELTGNDEHTLHTSVGEFVGSVRFAAPQFIRGEPFAPADDVYSLGATLYLLFTGRQVYSEIERKPLIPIAVTTRSPSVDSLQSEVPPAMKVLLEGTLNSSRARRPSLEEFKESIEDPDRAAYITKELNAQQSDARSYIVISVYTDGNSFFADLRGDQPALDEEYTVVRPLAKPITVPSYNREVVPEAWVGKAVLKHVHQGVGHFAVQHRRWRSNPAANIFGYGQWVDDEGTPLKVQNGDLVLRKS